MRFREVIGQKDIKERLLTSLQSDRVSHALLFSGNTGFGSLPLALAFVQYLFCTGEKKEDSCGQCPACRKIQKGIHPDLHFVYPIVKSSRIKYPVSDEYLNEWRNLLQENAYPDLEDWITAMGADDNAQALIYTEESASILRKLTMKSFESDYKAMIIWLPEKMKDECANKLLKILEEPYPNTLFILVSEHPEEMLNTILSRTQQINIPPLGKQELVQVLLSHCDLPEETAGDIAHIARGSWSLALKSVEKTEQSIYNQEKFVQLMRLCWERKMIPVNGFVNELSSLGREKQKSFLSHCIRMLRENFVSNFGLEELVYMTHKEKDFSVKFSPFVNENNIIPLYDEFEKAYKDVIRNGNGKIIFTDLCIKVMQNIRP